MADINIDLGIRQFNLGGKVSVEFNPTDIGFLEKLYGIMADLDKRQAEYEKKAREIDLEAGTEAGLAFFAMAHEADEYMRGQIDKLFGVDVCTPLLGDIHSYARSTDGLPIWMSILMAVYDQMDASLTQADKDAMKRIQKYTGKYSKYSKRIK